MASALATALRFRQPSVIPGFGLALGLTLTYLSLIVLIPLASMFLKTATLTWPQFWAIATDPRTLAALRLSFGAAFAAAVLNLVMGTVVAWVLVRYDFPFKRILDATVDLPFALPTAVAGIALAAIYAPNGWIGQFLDPLGVKVAYSPIGVVVALIFIAGNLPYVSEIAPLLIIIRLEEFDYGGATAIGTIMLLASFAMLLVINLVQSWSR